MSALEVETTFQRERRVSSVWDLNGTIPRICWNRFCFNSQIAHPTKKHQVKSIFIFFQIYSLDNSKRTSNNQHVKLDIFQHFQATIRNFDFLKVLLLFYGVETSNLHGIDLWILLSFKLYGIWLIPFLVKSLLPTAFKKKSLSNIKISAMQLLNQIKTSQRFLTKRFLALRSTWVRLEGRADLFDSIWRDKQNLDLHITILRLSLKSNFSIGKTLVYWNPHFEIEGNAV